MPKSSGELTADEIARIISKLEEIERERGQELVCSLCGSTNWLLGAYELSMPAATSNRYRGPLAYVRAVMVHCDTCGNMHLFPSTFFDVGPKDEDSERARDAG